MNEKISFLLADISTYIGLIPAFVALFRIKSRVYEHRPLSILVWGGVLVAIAAYVVTKALKLPNIFLLHIYTIFNFILTTLVFRSVISKKIAYILIFTYTVFASVNSIYIEKLITFNVLNRSISAFIIMFFALSFFVKTLKEMKILRLETIPLFWISVGALFYNAGSFFIFLFSKDISPFEELWLTYFGIHSILTIILYLFYTIALWVQPKQ
jgi:hypothetical protein